MSESTDTVTCEFWEGPMHKQTRVLKVSDLEANGRYVEVLECPPGVITETPTPLVTHAYRWHGGRLLSYQGRRRTEPHDRITTVLLDPPAPAETSPVQP